MKPSETSTSQTTDKQLTFVEQIQQGDRLFESKQWAEAIAAYSKAVELEPQSATPHVKLGNVFLEQGELEQARQQFQQAVELKPTLHWGHYGLAQVASRLEQWEQAEALYRRAIELKPDFAVAEQEVRVMLKQTGKDRSVNSTAQLADSKSTLNRRKENAQREISFAPPPLEVNEQYSLEEWIQKGDRLFEERRFEQALESYAKASEISPDLFTPVYKSGAIFLQQGDFEKAQEYFRKTITLKPEVHWGYYGLGNIATQQETWREAEKMFRKSIQLEPSFYWSHYKLGEVLAAQELWEPSVEAYRQAIGLDATLIFAYQKMGESLLQLNQIEDAEQVFQKALDLNSKFFWSHVRKVEALVKLARWEEAISACRKAINCDPELVGNTEYQPGKLILPEDFDIRAYAELNHLDSFLNDNPYQLIRHYLKFGKYEGREYKFSSATLQMRLGDQFAQESRWEEALAIYSHCLEVQPDLAGIHEKIGNALYQQAKSKPLKPNTNTSDSSSQTLTLNDYQQQLSADSTNAQACFRIYQLLQQANQSVEADHYYQQFFRLQKVKLEEDIQSYIATLFPSMQLDQGLKPKDIPQRTELKTRRVVFVLTALELLKVFSVFQQQQDDQKCQDCEDILIIGRGPRLAKDDLALKNAEVILQLARGWNFSRIVTIHGIEKLYHSKALDFEISTEWLREKIGLASAEFLYVQSNSAFGNQLLLGAYPNARRIAYGDSLGQLKLNQGISASPKGHIPVDEAYLITPLEIENGGFLQSQVSVVKSEHFISTIQRFADHVDGLKDYCDELKLQLGDVFTFLPTCYFSDGDHLVEGKFPSRLDAEVGLYSSYVNTHLDKSEKILIKGHPYQSSNQSEILTAELKSQGWQVIEIEKFRQVPIELFTAYLSIPSTLALFSSSCVSIALLCKTSVVIGASQELIEEYFSPVWSRRFKLLEFAYYIQLNQAYRKAFQPIRCSDLEEQLPKVVPLYPMRMSYQEFEASSATNMPGSFPKSLAKELATYYFVKGNQSCKANSIQEAALAYRLALELYPNSALIHNSLGKALIKQGHLKLAFEECQRAVELEENSSDFHQSLGETCIELGKRQLSINSYCKAIELKASSLTRKDDSSQRRLEGLVFMNSLKQPLSGMNRSLLEVSQILDTEKAIKLNFIVAKNAQAFKELSENLEKYDFVLFNSIAATEYMLQFKKVAVSALTKLGIPVFIYWHETDWALESWSKKHPIASIELANLISNHNVFHLTVSEACSQAISKRYSRCKSRIFNVHNCTSVPDPLPTPKLPDQPPYVINVATIQERKGTDLFIEVAIKVCRKHPTVKFIWLGHGSDFGSYDHAAWQEKIKAENFQERIVFTGHVDQPFDYVNQASLFFLSSKDDPFPLTILEAMAAGRTIITFKTGGAPEALGEYGITIEPFDVDAAANAILENLAKPAQKLVIPEMQRRYLDRYTPAKLAVRINSCIREAVDDAHENFNQSFTSYYPTPSIVYTNKISSKKECFIIGSGRSLLQLSSEDKVYLNAHANVLALNKYILFYEKIGVIPRAMFIADSHHPTPKIVFKIMKKASILENPPIYYLDEFYRKLFVIPPLESVWARKQRDKLFEKGEFIAPLGFDYSNVIFYKHRFGEYSGFSWAKSLREPLYWYHTSLITAINLAFIIYPGCDIKLLGIDLQGPEAFYHEEILQRPDIMDHHYQRSLQELGRHPTAVAEKDGKTMFDALRLIVPELQKHNVNLLSCNQQSLLVDQGICRFSSII